MKKIEKLEFQIKTSTFPTGERIVGFANEQDAKKVLDKINELIDAFNTKEGRK